MSPYPTRIGPTTPGTGEARVARRLHWAATVSLLTILPAAAQDNLRLPGGVLPCNELCRAWMLWGVDDRKGRIGPAAQVPGDAGHGRASLRSRATATGRLAPSSGVARRVEAELGPPGAAVRPLDGERRTPTERPRRRRPAPEPAQQLATARRSALKKDRPSEDLALASRGDGVDRERAAEDAAILARPLYRPRSAVAAPEEAARAMDHVGAGRPALEGAETASPRDAKLNDGSAIVPIGRAEPRAGLLGPTLPPEGRSSPVQAGADKASIGQAEIGPTTLPLVPDPVPQAKATRPRRTPERAGSAALPLPSELEGLDGIGAPAPFGTGLPSVALPLLLGSLALASLIGSCRRMFGG